MLSLPRLQLICAALLMSAGGAAIKGCESFSSWQIASFRAGIAATILLLAVPGIRRHWNWRTVSIGAAYAGASVLFVLANKLTTAANAIYLQCTYPIAVVLLSTCFLKEPLRRRDAFFMMALAAGLAFFFFGGTQASASAPDPVRGNMMAMVSGLFWAITVTGLRWLTQRGGREEVSGAAAVAIGCLIACVITLPFALPVQESSVADWLIVAYLGCFGIALVFILINRALKKVSAIEAGLLLLIEPALNPLWAWALQGENPGPPAMAGGVIILVATAFHPCWPADGDPALVDSRLPAEVVIDKD